MNIAAKVEFCSLAMKALEKDYEELKEFCCNKETEYSQCSIKAVGLGGELKMCLELDLITHEYEQQMQKNMIYLLTARQVLENESKEETCEEQELTKENVEHPSIVQKVLCKEEKKNGESNSTETIG